MKKLPTKTFVDVDACLEKLRRQEALINTVDGILWEADATTFKFTFVSQQAERILGYPVASWYNEENFWVNRVHPNDREWSVKFCVEQTQKKLDHIFEYRMIAADGHIVWLRDVVHVVLDEPIMLRGLMVDITDLKKMQSELIHTKEMLSTVMDAVPQTIFWKDVALNYVGCNRRFAEAAGFASQSEVIGKTDYDLWNKEDAEFYRQCDKRAMVHDQPILRMLETRIKSDGDVLWAETSKIPLHDAEGRVMGIMGTYEDISERKKIEETLQRTQMCVDLAGDAILWVDHTGTIQYVNEAACYAWGYTANELKQLQIYDLFPSLNKQSWPKEWLRLQEKKRHLWESMVQCKHMPNVPVEVTVTHLSFADAEMICLFARDIRDRKCAEERLRESEELYRSLVENTSDGYWRWDLASLQPLFCNQRGCVMLGFDKEEMMQLSLPEMVAQRDHEQLWHLIQKVSFGEKYPAQGWSLNVLRKDGSECHVEMTVTRINLQGRPVLQGVMRDVTEQEQLRRELQQIQKMEALGTFAGGIAHDFNNILGAIFGFGELARDGVNGNSEVAEYLDMLLKAAERARDLVAQILVFSRRFDEEKHALNPLPVLKEVIRFLRATIPSTIEIHTHWLVAEGYVYADPSQVHQLLMNLVANAGHAMRQQGGILTVTLDEKEINEEEASVWQRQKGHYLRLHVRDTGEGMAHNIMDRIFDPFFTTKKMGEGTGMGLSVVHGIVADLKGYIQVESRLGEGSCFTIYLPKAIHVDKEEVVRSCQKIIPKGSGHVLLVDDDPMLLLAMRRMLEDMGFQAATYLDPLEAWAAFYREPDFYDVVITDQTMPKLTGVDLLKRIHEIRPEKPVIVCSGFSAQMSVDEVRLLGMSAFIQKPVNRQTLAETLSRTIHCCVLH